MQETKLHVKKVSRGQTIKADASQFLQQMKGGGVLYLNFKI
ncbi:hypothetical protein WCV21_07555 [Lactobacillus helveticus]|nr:hypothetical protein [Lactobacillus helveticus]NRO49604.1 hypothetical protein [Lactobacillus helveticus]NRO58654.1 hypothetical protein [Lactobacillus helveticus]NRO74529.1 hypothetical protein [Lactobacillus helveticus]